MIELGPFPAPVPSIGDRVRWHWPAGCYFGRVVSITDEGATVLVRIEDTVLEVAVPASKVTVLSAPQAGAA